MSKQTVFCFFFNGTSAPPGNSHEAAALYQNSYSKSSAIQRCQSGTLEGKWQTCVYKHLVVLSRHKGGRHAALLHKLHCGCVNMDCPLERLNSKGFQLKDEILFSTHRTLQCAEAI